MMPGFINNTLEQQRRVQRLVNERILQFFKDNPIPAGNPGKDATDEQVMEAVVSYMQANRVKGDKGDAGTTSWNGITDKPLAFPPAAHSHAWNDITAKPLLFPPSTHNHAINEITGLQASLDAKLSSVSWAIVSGKPSTFPPSAHTHSITDVTGLQAALDVKGNVQVATFTIAETMILGISAGVRIVNIPVAGVVPGANYRLFRTASGTANLGIFDCACFTAGTLEVRLQVPALVLGASYSVPVRLVRLNT